MDTQLDPQAVNLTKAIRQTESGGNFTAKGKSGEYGAYQFTQPTWEAYSKKYGVNVPLQQATPEQQNEVAYKQIKEWKDKGHNVGEIASMWNAGEGRPKAYQENVTGTNDYGVHYDTPTYAKNVATTYQSLKGQEKQVYNPKPFSNPTNPGTFSVTNSQNVSQERTNLEAQGQPVSVNPEKAQPTFGGSIIRGLISPFAKSATSIINLGQDIVGAPETNPLSGGYLGEVNKWGKGFDITKGLTPENIKAVKESAGGGLELASYLVGGGEAKAGLEAAQAGKLFTKGILKTAGKGALEGSGIGALGGAGTSLQKDEGLGKFVTSTLGGAVMGGITGGVLGTVGSFIAKAKGITGDTINQIKNMIGKDYTESLGSTVSGRKVLNENAEGIQASLEAGILPEVKNGRYDTSQATTILQEMMDKLGKARGEDVLAHNQPVDTATLKQTIMNNVNQFVQDPLEKQKVTKTIEDWFTALGNGKMTLEKLNKLQIHAGKLAKFENTTDATIRNAYRNIYHGMGTFINDTVGGNGGVNKEVNDTLTKYHKIMDFLDALNEKPVADKGLVSILASHAAKTAATGLGASVGGAPGAIIANESMPILTRVIRKILGADNSAYEKVMEAVRSGEQNKIDDILKQVEKNKGTQFARDIQRALDEVKQLPAPTGKMKKGLISEVYKPINLNESSSIEKPATRIIRHNTQKPQLLLQEGKKGFIGGEPIKLPSKATELSKENPANKIRKHSYNSKNKKYYTKGLLGGGNP